MFDYSFLHAPPPEGIARLLREISQLQDRLLACKRSYPGIYSSLERTGRVRSLQAACGARNMESRAAEVCARNSPPINEVEKSMADYRDALFEVQMGHPALEPCCRDLLRLHKIALLHTQPEQAGMLREGADLEPWEQAVQRIYAEDSVPMLLAAPCLLADFICLSPFEPGGQRMAYLLARLLLQKAGAALSVSWEEQVDRYRVFYADSLNHVQISGDYWPFIECFLTLLYLCGCQAEKAFTLLPGRKMTKKSRVEAIVAGSPVPISKSEICRLLPDVSPTTVEAALGELVKNGQIVRSGSARTARYATA